MRKSIVENIDFDAKHLGEGCQLHEPNSNKQNGRPPGVKQRPDEEAANKIPPGSYSSLCLKSCARVLRCMYSVAIRLSHSADLKLLQTPIKVHSQRLEISLA